MDIEQLESVLAVAKHRNFTIAAYETSTSQSTISKYIKSIEDSLGVRLFKRSSRRVELTPAGDTFVKHAQRVLAEFEDMKSAMKEHRALEKGSLNLGCIAVVGRLGLTAAIADFQRKYPGIHIKFYERNTSELLEMLQRLQIDIAILSPPLVADYQKTIEMYPLIEDEIVVVVDEFHPLAIRHSIKLSEISQESFILLNSTTVMYSIAMESCQMAGFVPNIIYESTHIDTILGLVVERLGITLLPSKQVNHMPGAVLIQLDPPVRHTTSLAVSKEFRNRNTEKAFIDHIIKWSNK